MGAVSTSVTLGSLSFPPCITSFHKPVVVPLPGGRSDPGESPTFWKHLSTRTEALGETRALPQWHWEGSFHFLTHVSMLNGANVDRD